MVNKILVILVIALLAALIIVGWLSHQAGVKSRELKVQYDAEKQELTEQKAAALDRIEDLRNLISQKDEKIRNIISDVKEKNDKIAGLHKKTEKLEADYANAVTDVTRLDNLTKQVNAWKEKFALAEKVIADKDAIIFSLTEKYEAQVVISLEWKALYEKEMGLRKLAEARLKIADRRISGLKIGGTIKTGLILGMAGVVVYGLVK